MRTLLDTNILLRAHQPSSPHFHSAVNAVMALINAGHRPCISSQSIYEFLAVATRPVSENGLGMPHPDADALLAKLLVGIEVVYDSSALVSELRRLVVAHRVTGKKVHDTRLVAAMRVNAIDQLLTFNDSDFRRFADIRVLTPDQVLAGPPAP